MVLLLDDLICTVGHIALAPTSPVETKDNPWRNDKIRNSESDPGASHTIYSSTRTRVLDTGTLIALARRIGVWRNFEEVAG